MAADVIICPWCQSEIIQEPGQEPEKYCPVCDNELSGYRTLRIGLGDEDDPDYDEDEDEDEEGAAANGLASLEGLEAEADDALRAKDEALLRYESAVETLLDEQEFVPECPQCREYMLEAGRQIVEPSTFAPRRSELPGGRPIVAAPFEMTVYVCPSCFTMTHMLAEDDRSRMAESLARQGEAGERRAGGR